MTHLNMLLIEFQAICVSPARVVHVSYVFIDEEGLLAYEPFYRLLQAIISWKSQQYMH